MTGPLILPYRDILPRIHPSAFIAPNAVVIGNVEIGAHANIWFNVVIRGDDAPIRIGAGANIQDGTVVHVTHDVPQGDISQGGEHIPCLIGDDVAIGHLALLHGCTLEPGAFVGMKACVMDKAVVQSGAMVAAGAVVTPRKISSRRANYGPGRRRAIRAISSPRRSNTCAGCRAITAGWQRNTRRRLIRHRNARDVVTGA